MRVIRQSKNLNKKTPQKIVNSDSKLIIFIFVAFFSTFIIVDIAYIYTANNTWRGVVTEDSYQKGLNYNRNLTTAKAQKSLGWNIHINYKALKNRLGIVQVKLSDKDHNSIKDAIITAKITRPTQQGYDFSVNLVFNSQNNSYDSKIFFPLIGQWDIEVKAIKNSDLYQDGKRLIVQ